MAYFQIKKKNKISIILGTLLSKEVVVDSVVVLVVLVEQISQIFLRTSLETLEVVEDQEIEVLIIEVQI